MYLELLVGEEVKHENVDRAKIDRVRVGSRLAICLKKYDERPYRKFRNSRIDIPPASCELQAYSFPTPFPIRIPLDFLLNGRCGKILNHAKRRVLSDRFVAFLRNIFKLKIRFPVKRNGLRFNKPASPYDN